MDVLFPKYDAVYWRDRWRLSLYCFAASVVVVIVIFLESVAGAVHQWVSVSSYGYCLLIVPLMVHMVWTNRRYLRDLAPEPSRWGAAAIALFGLVWCLAFVAGIAEVAQFAVVGVIQGLLLSVFGFRVYRRLWLPFTFLWLLVPTGEFLVPFLQSATAIGSTYLLELSGILTFRENLTIMVPSGSYVVAPGCSGLSFLMSALVVSVTFADTFFRSRIKKIAIVLLSLVLSIGANVLRVFLIIAIADATDNIADIADDHLFYGWVFFSLLLLGALAVGHRFRDVIPPQPPGGPRVEGPPVALTRTAGSLGLALVAAVVPLTVSVALSDNGNTRLSMPRLSCGAFPVSVRKPSSWTPPSPQDVDGSATIDCDVGGRAVGLVVVILERPVRLGKLIGLERKMIDRDNWTRLQTGHASIVIDGRREPVQTELIGRGPVRRLVWSLFWTDGEWRAPGFDAFWADVRSDLTGRRRAAAILVTTGDVADSREAATVLQNFLAGLPLRALVDGEPQHSHDNAERW